MSGHILDHSLKQIRGQLQEKVCLGEEAKEKVLVLVEKGSVLGSSKRNTKAMQAEDGLGIAKHMCRNLKLCITRSPKAHFLMALP